MMVDMSEFANVLRSWRDRVRPEAVGLPAGPGRRTRGSAARSSPRWRA